MVGTGAGIFERAGRECPTIGPTRCGLEDCRRDLALRAAAPHYSDPESPPQIVVIAPPAHQYGEARKTSKASENATKHEAAVRQVLDVNSMLRPIADINYS